MRRVWVPDETDEEENAPEEEKEEEEEEEEVPGPLYSPSSERKHASCSHTVLLHACLHQEEEEETAYTAG